MLRHRTKHIDATERLRKNRQTQLLILLQKCLQISKDDRILLRTLIKQQNRQVVNLLLPYRKQHPNLSELQVELRKFVTGYRNKTQENCEFRKLTHRVTSLQGTNRTRQSEPLQLKLTVEQGGMMIRRGEYERRFTGGGTGKSEVLGLGMLSEDGSDRGCDDRMDARALREEFERQVEQEIDEELERELRELTIQEIKTQEINQPDESLNESVLQQFKPFESTLIFSNQTNKLKCIDDLNWDKSEIEVKTPTLATTSEVKNLKNFAPNQTDMQDSVNNSLKEKAQIWYKQFMAQTNKFKVGRIEPSEHWQAHQQPKQTLHQQQPQLDPQPQPQSQPSPTQPHLTSTQSQIAHFPKPPSSQTHKKGLSLNLNLKQIPTHHQPTELDSQLFSFRKEREPKYGEFYKRLKMQLENV